MNNTITVNLSNCMTTGLYALFTPDVLNRFRFRFELNWMHVNELVWFGN